MADKPYFIILGASAHQASIYSMASKLGLKTLALDYNPNAEAVKLADKFLLASANNNNKEECINKLKELGLKYSGVIASGIERSPLAAAIAKEFNLIWVSEETANNTTNKCARSLVLAKAGIPIPKFEIVDSSAFPKLDFPLVIKPSDNSGSRGVRIVQSKNEWPKAYEEAKFLSSDGKVIAEEMLNGDEISIEGFMLNGQMFVHGFTDRNFIPGFEPYFMEDGSTGPSRLSLEVIAEAKDVFTRAGRALGITEGPSKGDLKVTKDGVKVLEITSRFSPLFPMITPLVVGADPLEAVVRWAAGMEVPQSLLEHKFNKGVAHRYFYHTPGKIISVSGFENLKNQPGVALVVRLGHFNIGDILTPCSYINRLFYIVAIADDRDTAIKLANNALKTVKIEVA